MPETAPAEQPSPVLGYPAELSVVAGASLPFHVDGRDGSFLDVDVVEFSHADLSPEGLPLEETPVAVEGSGRWPAHPQRCTVGSYGFVDPWPELAQCGSLTFSVRVWSSLPATSGQWVASHWNPETSMGWCLQVGGEEGVSLLIGHHAGAEPTRLCTKWPLARGCWVELTAALDLAHGRATLTQRPLQGVASRLDVRASDPQRLDVEFPPDLTLGTLEVPLLIAGEWSLPGTGPPSPAGSYTGKLERPEILGGYHPDPASSRPNALATWDVAAGIGRGGFAAPELIPDVSGNGPDLRLVNRPMLAVTSSAWDSTHLDFRSAPELYAAVKFHVDDVAELDWSESFRLAIPPSLRSGVYAARVRTEESVDRIPFVVRPAEDRPTARMAMVLPTYSYLAYANDRLATDSLRLQSATGHVPVMYGDEAWLLARRELGASLYDKHIDGTGVCYSTSRRPIFTMRPQHRNVNARAWQFTADLQIIRFLRHEGFEFDVLTDHDVHREGAELLGRYQVLVSGTHPEYVTAEMLDAFDAYLSGGGRMTYLGGNGYYWVTAVSPGDGTTVEVRRFAGSEAWTAAPGEAHLSFTGEPGGLWRHRGRAPQRLFGVGTVGVGSGRVSTYYRRTDASYDLLAWAFEGCREGPTFGAYGTIGGGAAGMEIDATDDALGTSPDAVVVAYSEDHDDSMLEVRENYGWSSLAVGGSDNPRVRSDLTLVPYPGGGAVFSVGSIAWSGALNHDDGDVARITRNVLARFLDVPVGVDPLEDR